MAKGIVRDTQKRGCRSNGKSPHYYFMTFLSIYRNLGKCSTYGAMCPAPKSILRNIYSLLCCQRGTSMASIDRHQIHKLNLYIMICNLHISLVVFCFHMACVQVLVNSRASLIMDFINAGWKHSESTAVFNVFMLSIILLIAEHNVCLYNIYLALGMMHSLYTI